MRHVTHVGHGSGATNVLGLSISPMLMLRPEGADEIETVKQLKAKIAELKISAAKSGVISIAPKHRGFGILIVKTTISSSMHYLGFHSTKSPLTTKASWKKNKVALTTRWVFLERSL